MIKQKWPIFILILGLFLPLSNASAGTILSSYKYAWSNNGGYINFENVVVSDNQLSGFAWSAIYGWIKFNPAQGGVINDGTGNLSGSVWGEKLGWINFDGVSINGSTGKFSGSATGALIGTINFDCPNYCDVRTDWRQAATPVVPSSGGGGGGGGSVPTPESAKDIPDDKVPEVPPIQVYNAPLVLLPDQSGTITQDTPVGKVILEVPVGAVPDKTTFTILDEPVHESTVDLVIKNTKLVNSVFYNVSAIDENGNEVHFFENPIVITLPVSIELASETDLAVYWLNETNWQWVLIPDAIFSKGKVTFTMSHLTKFAIFATKDLTTGMPATTIPSLPLPLDKKPSQTSTTTDQNNYKQNPTEINAGLVVSDKNYYWNFLIPLAILVPILLLVFLRRKK